MTTAGMGVITLAFREQHVAEPCNFDVLLHRTPGHQPAPRNPVRSLGQEDSL